MKLEVDIKCPNCQKMMKTKFEEMVPGKKKNCPHCETEIIFTGDDMRKAQKAIDDFEKSMKNMFK